MFVIDVLLACLLNYWMLQVRVTAMVKGITKIDIDDVPPHIKSFLEKLISDGNFFRSDFLYSFESSALEFDK